MHCPDNPTGRIQWPGLFATMFVLLFAIAAHVLLTVASSMHHPHNVVRPCLSQLFIAFSLGRAWWSLSVADRSTAPIKHEAPHARVVRLPATWAPYLPAIGPIPHLTSAYRSPILRPCSAFTPTASPRRSEGSFTA